MRYKYIFTTCIVISLTACSSLTPKNDFAELANHTYKTTGKQLIWKSDNNDKKYARNMTHKLLQNKLTLDKVIRIALINNTELQEKYEMLGISAANVFAASRMTNPSVETQVFFPANSQTRGTDTEITATINATDLLKLPTRKHQAKTEHEKTVYQLKNKISATIKSVKLDYYDCLYYQAQLDNNSERIRLQMKFIKEVKKHFQAGLQTDINIFEATADLNTLKFEREELIKKKNETYLNLINHIGLNPINTNLNITDNFTPPPKKRFDKIKLWNHVRNNNSTIQAACLDVKIAEDNIKLKKSNLFGDVNVGAEFDRNADNERKIAPTVDFMLPIFHQNQGEMTGAYFELEKSKKAYLSTLHNYQYQLMKILNNIESNQRTLDIYNSDVLKLQNQLSDLAQKLDEKMQINKLKLIETQIHAINMRSRYLEIIHDTWLNYAELEALY